MQITVTKLTDIDFARKACQFTLHSQNATKIGLSKLYGGEHSPCRTQLYWIEMIGIPSFVSTHFVRHKIGVEHFVQTNRDDRGADTVADRNTPVNHAMLINAQALINMARKRLCFNTHQKTRKAMVAIKKAVEPELQEWLVADCVYRGYKCYEPKSCGACEQHEYK